MTLDLREILKAPLHISANPHFYDCSAEQQRRYYRGGREFKHREILAMGLPASAIS